MSAKSVRRHLTVSSLLLLLAWASLASAGDGYQKPPKAVTDILDALPPPLVSVSPTRQFLEIQQMAAHPSIADLAEPMLRLAGHRINPKTNGPARPPRCISISLMDIAKGESRTLELPAGARPGMSRWSPDGKHIAFCNTTADGIELWIVDVVAANARQIPNVRVNAVYGQPFSWMPDNRTLLCKTVPANRGQPPDAAKVPAGPTIQESSGSPGANLPRPPQKPAR